MPFPHGQPGQSCTGSRPPQVITLLFGASPRRNSQRPAPRLLRLPGGVMDSGIVRGHNNVTAGAWSPPSQPPSPFGSAAAYSPSKGGDGLCNGSVVCWLGGGHRIRSRPWLLPPTGAPAGWRPWLAGSPSRGERLMAALCGSTTVKLSGAQVPPPQQSAPCAICRATPGGIIDNGTRPYKNGIYFAAPSGCQSM